MGMIWDKNGPVAQPANFVPPPPPPQPPSWIGFPPTNPIQITQGNVFSLTGFFSPANCTLVVNPLTTPLPPPSQLLGNSAISVPINTNTGTTTGCQLIATDPATGLSTPSPLFNIQINPAGVSQLGTWFNLAVLTMQPNTQYDIVANGWVLNAVNVTYTAEAVIATAGDNLVTANWQPLATALPWASFSSAGVLSLTAAAPPQKCDITFRFIYIRFTMHDQSGNTLVSTMLCSLAIAAAGTVVYKNPRLSKTYNDAPGVAGMNLAMADPLAQNGDVLTFSAGQIGSTVPSWFPPSNKSFVLQCDTPGGILVKDGSDVALQGLRTVMLSHGQQSNAPVNFNIEVNGGLWMRGNKVANTNMMSDPSSEGAMCRFDAVVNGTQNWFLHDLIWEDCNQAMFTSAGCGPVTVWNSYIVNCGITTPINCHGFYVDCNPFDWRGNFQFWTYDYAQLSPQRDRWACCGHAVKMRGPKSRVCAGKILTASTYGGSASTTEKCDFADGGIAYVIGLIPEENVSSGILPSFGFTSPDDKIIGYCATGRYSVNQLYVYQSTVPNNGSTVEQFVRWIQQFAVTVQPVTVNPTSGSSNVFYVNTTSGYITFFAFNDANGPVTWQPNPPAWIESAAGTRWSDGLANMFTFGTGAIQGISASAPGAPANFYYMRLISFTHPNILVFALATSYANAQAGIFLPLSSVTPGTIVMYNVPDKFDLRDNCFLGTTSDQTVFNSTDGSTYANTNTVGPLTLLQDTNPLDRNFALTSPVLGTGNNGVPWTDDTGAANYYNPA